MFDARPNYSDACKRAGDRAPEFKQAVTPRVGGFCARRVLILPTVDKASWERVGDDVVQVMRPAYTTYRRRGDGKIDGSGWAFAKDLTEIEDLDEEYKSK